MPDFDEQAVRAIQSEDQLEAADEQTQQAFRASSMQQEGVQTQVSAVLSDADDANHA